MPTRQMPMRRALGPLLAAAFLARPAIAMAAAPAEELMALYRRFVAAHAIPWAFSSTSSFSISRSSAVSAIR